MANPQVVLQLTASFFRRNNPVDALLNGLIEGLNNLITFNSKMKLLKYKFMLAQQQMRTLEQHIDSGSPYEVKGNKIDRAY